MLVKEPPTAEDLAQILHLGPNRYEDRVDLEKVLDVYKQTKVLLNIFNMNKFTVISIHSATIPTTAPSMELRSNY